MLEVVPSATLAALAGVMPRGSDASATAAVLARERLRRLERGTTTSCQKVGVPPLCPNSAAVSAWCDTSPVPQGCAASTTLTLANALGGRFRSRAATPPTPSGRSQNQQCGHQRRSNQSSIWIQTRHSRATGTIATTRTASTATSPPKWYPRPHHRNAALPQPALITGQGFSVEFGTVLIKPTTDPL